MQGTQGPLHNLHLADDDSAKSSSILDYRLAPHPYLLATRHCSCPCSLPDNLADQDLLGPLHVE